MKKERKQDRWVRKSFVYVITTFTGIGGILFGYEIGLVASLLTVKRFRTDFDLDADFQNQTAQTSETNIREGLITTGFAAGCASNSKKQAALSAETGRPRI